MKRLLSAIAAGFTRWIGLDSEPSRPSKAPALSEAEKVVDRLIEMGYVKFAPESRRYELRHQLIGSLTVRYLETEWNEDCVTADLRSYPADNEDLAEGQVGATILLMREVLEQEGVKLDSVVDDFGEERYEVVINGQRYLIYEDDGGTNSWTLSLKRLLEIVNALLEEAGSAERLFAVYTGNDGRVILLTPQMLDYIESIGDVLDQDWVPRRVEQIELGD